MIIINSEKCDALSALNVMTIDCVAYNILWFNYKLLNFNSKGWPW